MALAPLASHSLLDEAYVTGITGATGAGQSLSPTSHFPYRQSNISAYKTLVHQHLGEIGETLAHVYGGRHTPIHFVPWRGDFSRGIFVSAMVHCDLDKNHVDDLYRSFYKGALFTQLVDDNLHLKRVTNTNYCALSTEKDGDTLVVHAAIDNLLKGASGQAVQNMNLMFGIAEDEGLRLKANYF